MDLILLATFEDSCKKTRGLATLKTRGLATLKTRARRLEGAEIEKDQGRHPNLPALCWKKNLFCSQFVEVAVAHDYMMKESAIQYFVSFQS